MDAVVLDAQPLVAYLLDEPLADAVDARLRAAQRAGRCLVGTVNWCEVLYIVRRTRGPRAAARAGKLLEAASITLVDADAELATFAAEIKSRYGLALGDSFAAALAIATGSPLMTADTDFLPLAEHGLKLDWLG